MSNERKYNVHLNLMGNELRNGLLQNFATLPAGVKRQIGYDAAQDTPVFHDGTSWVVLDPRKATNIPLAALAVNPLARANHTGTQTVSTISDFSTSVRAVRLNEFAAPNAAVAFGNQKLTGLATPTVATDATTKGYVDAAIADVSAQDAIKLKTPRNFSISGIITSPTVSFDGTADVQLVASVADGALSISKVNGLQGALDAKINSNLIGVANGVAPLDAGAKIAASFLPSFVDDVVEATNFAALPASGETGKVYVTLDNGNVYRWSGSAYVRINDSVSTADSATRLATARTFSLTGIITAAAVSFNGTANVALATAIADNALTIAKTSGLQTALNAKAGKFSALIGNGVLTVHTITHNLNTQDVIVSVRNVATNEHEYVGVVAKTVNTVELHYTSPPDNNAHRVTVIG